jgi:hypothetical protein
MLIYCNFKIYILLEIVLLKKIIYYLKIIYLKIIFYMKLLLFILYWVKYFIYRGIYILLLFITIKKIYNKKYYIN